MEADPLGPLRRRFPGKSREWLRRALARVGDVSEGPGYYVVKGRPELGDRYPQYHVWWSEAERRWLCTCYLTEWGRRRARDICTHVAAVVLYRAHRSVEAREGRYYVATAVVECPERPSADGEVYAKPVAGRSIADYARPRWRIAVVSRRPRVVVTCGGRPVAELDGVEATYGEARVLAEEYVDYLKGPDIGRGGEI
ncbi:MAG: hypothetical protein ACP5HD_08530 [Thermoproteus sp.]